MNTESITIQAEPRPFTSKSSNRRVRTDGFVPGTLYAKGAATNLAVAAKSLPKEHTRAKVVQLNFSGSIKNVLMREVQVNPLTDQPIHFDFQEVSGADVVRASVPLDYVGFTREQEKEGTLGILVRFLDVQAKVENLPESIKVDVSALKAGGSVRLFDLELPAGLTVRTGKGQNVALASLISAAQA